MRAAELTHCIKAVAANVDDKNSVWRILEWKEGIASHKLSSVLQACTVTLSPCVHAWTHDKYMFLEGTYLEHLEKKRRALFSLNSKGQINYRREETPFSIWVCS